jgi:hypothetical protein
MIRLVAAFLATGITLLLVAVVPMLSGAAMSLFESLSPREQGALRVGMLTLSTVALCAGGWLNRRPKQGADRLE